MRSVAVSILLWLTLAPAPFARPATPIMLPTVSFYSLSKDRLTLPADFKRDRNLLLLYFDLTQQPDVDNWNGVIDRWRAADPSLASYTSLVSTQKNFLSRWWQNASMRSASPDASHWPTTLPLYLDRPAFERKLGIASEKQVVLLLLDHAGHVLATVNGPATEQNQAAMRAALHTAGAPAVPAPSAAKP